MDRLSLIPDLTWRYFFVVLSILLEDVEINEPKSQISLSPRLLSSRLKHLHYNIYEETQMIIILLNKLVFFHNYI